MDPNCLLLGELDRPGEAAFPEYSLVWTDCSVQYEVCTSVRCDVCSALFQWDVQKPLIYNLHLTMKYTQNNNCS